ncbi:MAG: HDOD domain-containing protein [bacterium]|nr:HDOD domain-containing protein [bacterium]
MGEVNVDDLKAGMVLADDLKDAKGRFLLGRGVPIEEKHVRIMKIWGITSADIEGVSREEVVKEAMGRIDPKILAEITKQVDELFCNSTRDHPALQELKRLCILRTASKHSKPCGEENGQSDLSESDSPPGEKVTSLDELVEKNVQLSSFPDIYYQIMNVLNDTHSSATHLANVVSKDPSLSASLLKLVNSAFFGLPSKVDSITRAVALIGGRELSALAMGISVIRFFKDIPPRMVDMKNFWLHSVACGVFARVLATRKAGLVEEFFFIGGLLHDIGRLVMFIEYPKTMVYLINLSQKRKAPLFRIEREVLGYDHAEVTGLLLKKWNFPLPLARMIRYHHTPLASKDSLEASIILVSDILATAFRFGYSGNCYAPAFEQKVWATIDLSPSVFDLSIKQAERQVTETLDAFNLDKSE